jgi:uncharacterized membrane protein YqjE
MIEQPPRSPIVAMASSLLADLRRLVAQELQLAKHEMQQELAKLAKAAIHAGIVVILSLMALILLCLTLVYVLHSVLGLSLWASYGAVALLAAAGAAGLAYRVVTLAPTLRLWPVRTLHTLKEDAQWIAEQVLSPKA